MRTGRPPKPLAERFWSYVHKSEGCWEWQGTKYPNGRGQIKVSGKTQKAYRVAWELSRGPIPDGLFVCHRCDNPSCVRPDHLFLGTHLDNQRDAHAKGRTRFGPKNGTRTQPHRVAKGERVNTARLSAAQVRAIRERYASGNVTQGQLAAEYGVWQTTIAAIVHRRTWRHLEIVPDS